MCVYKVAQVDWGVFRDIDQELELVFRYIRPTWSSLNGYQ